MAGITSLGTTFNLPNYNGQIWGLTPDDTPLSSAIGVLSGDGEAIHSKDFEWQTYDLRAVEIPAHLEGQDAPTARERVRASVSNVAQIFHSQVSISYTKAAAMGQRDGLNNVQPTAQADEMSWQVVQELKSLKRDIEHVFINGAYAKPADNATARKTRGLLEAITTNTASALETGGRAITIEADDDLVTLASHGLVEGQAVKISALTGGTGLTSGTVYYVKDIASTSTFKLSATQGGAAINVTADASAGTLQAYRQLTEKMVLDLMQLVWENGGIQESETATIMANAAIKRQLTTTFVTNKNYREETRNVGGVSVQTIETDFGKLNLMLNRYMPKTTLAVVSLEALKPKILLIPEKGFLFLEPLAKTGASEKAQLYGEIGLEYGSQLQHGTLTELSGAAA